MKVQSKPYPSDDDIVRVMTKWGRGSGDATYVIANGLKMDGYFVESTTAIRKSLERLERRGRVERVPSNYARDICWVAKVDLA